MQISFREIEGLFLSPQYVFTICKCCRLSRTPTFVGRCNSVIWFSWPLVWSIYAVVSVCSLAPAVLFFCFVFFLEKKRSDSQIIVVWNCSVFFLKADLGSLSAQLVILGLAIGADIFALMRSEMFLFSPSRLTLMHRWCLKGVRGSGEKITHRKMNFKYIDKLWLLSWILTWLHHWSFYTFWTLTVSDSLFIFLSFLHALNVCHHMALPKNQNWRNSIKI